MARISPWVLFLCFSSLACAQQKIAAPPQSPRQALIEMVQGGGAAISKHLTVEMQEAIKEAAKGYKIAASAPKSSAASPSDTTTAQEKNLPEPHTVVRTADNSGGMAGFNFGLLGFQAPMNKNLEAFESGPVLFTYNDPSTKEKMEVRLEGDDLRGTEDDMQLSFHLFKDGQEQAIPFLDRVTVRMKMQQGTWRLNEISAEVKASVGDPKFFEDMQKAFQSDAPVTNAQVSAAAKDSAREEEHTTMPVSSAVTMLAFAEDMYARSNPDAGFTCNLADLVGEKAGGTFAGYLDPQIATGTYNSYHFSISGCNSRPSEIFHLVAEPLTPGGKAYCINGTHNLRISDDGRGATCLVTGNPATGD